MNKTIHYALTAICEHALTRQFMILSFVFMCVLSVVLPYLLSLPFLNSFASDAEYLLCIHNTWNWLPFREMPKTL